MDVVADHPLNGRVVMTTEQMNRLERADLASGTGALVLGTGPGTLLAPYLAPAAVAVLVGGLLLHAWGMYDKHRLEREEGAAPRYAAVLYWLCWAVLALLAAYLVLRAVDRAAASGFSPRGRRSAPDTRRPARGVSFPS